MDIPPFKCYFPSISDMDAEQRAFYEHWVRSWEQGTAVQVDGSISYLFCYTYGVLALPHERREQELRRLIDAYEARESKFASYCQHWLADCYLARGDIRGALSELPELGDGSKATGDANRRISLRLFAGLELVADELVAITGYKATRWGQKHAPLVYACLEHLQAQQTDPSLRDEFAEWAEYCHQIPLGLQGGSFRGSDCYLIMVRCFDMHPPCVDRITGLIREAENKAREERGLPRVGEGWISETALFYELREALAPFRVLHHASPEWLGRQHLDVYVPGLKAAVEFQGQQHDQPVDFFGGEDAFRKTRRRDATKRRLCQANGIRLIEVRPGYDIAAVLSQIVDGYHYDKP